MAGFCRNGLFLGFVGMDDFRCSGLSCVCSKCWGLEREPPHPPSSAVIPGLMRPVPSRVTWAMHPNNWAVAQGRMMGTEPHSFPSLCADSFSLVSLEEVRGSTAHECHFTVSSETQSSQFKTRVFCDSPGSETSVCRCELMATPPAGLATEPTHHATPLHSTLH